MSRPVLLATVLATSVLATSVHAQVLSVALKPLAAAPVEEQAATTVKGGAICIKQGPITGAEIRNAITSGEGDTRLREALTNAGILVGSPGAAAVEVAGAARASLIDVCLPSWGFGNVDTIGGKVEVAVDWTLIDRATGAEIGRLSTRELLERKAGPGGLRGMMDEALAANARALAANPALRQAAARPAPASATADAAARDATVFVQPPWRRTTPKTPIAITAPRVVESDFDMFDNGDNLNLFEYFAITLEAGETLRLEVLETSTKTFLAITDPKNRYVAVTDPRSPERQLSWTAKTAGTYVAQVSSKGSPPVGPYRLKIDTDRHPYVAWQPPKPMAARPAQIAAVATPAPPRNSTTAPKPAPAPALPAAPKLTPPPGVLAAEVGKSIARPAGKVGAGVDLFAFIGEAGAVLQATAGAPRAGGHAITLFTPEGAEVLTADGVDQTRLSAVLPKDGVYLLSVGRQNAAKPYKLTLTAEAPDLFQWSFRKLAGYEVIGRNGQVLYATCWTAPGSTLRYDFPNGQKISLSVQRGGAGRWETNPPRPFTTHLAAGVFVRTYADGGKPDTWSLDGEQSATGPYRGYLCR